MKKQLVLAGILLVSVISFGQKKEIKKAEKQIKSGEYVEAMASLAEAEAQLANADSEMKAQFYVVKATALMESAGSDTAKMKMASEALASAKAADTDGKSSKMIEDAAQALKSTLESKASADYNAKRYDMAAEKFYTAYTLNPKDTLFLFNAAVSSKIANNTDKAATYFQSLADIGYTGIQKQFVATDVATGEIEPFVTKSQRDLMVKAGTHAKPAEQLTESKRELVLLSLAQINMEKGDDEKALEIISEVRKANPKDVTLIQVEADMVYKQGNMERYNELMQELISIDPTNPDLYNNLGVANAKLGLNEKAIEYYNKAIELNPENSGAQINIAVLILSGEEALNEEMNALGTSKADYAKYDELKEQKNQLYRKAMPYLESALKTRADNIEIVRTLMGIYSQIGEDDKFKAMKVRLQEMEGGQ
jgi:tetratricopeptide (TPR) repeat protein